MPATSNEEFNRQVVARYSRTNRSREDFESRCALLRRRLAEKDFLSNKGIGNEIGFFTFCYDPSLELQAREFAQRIVRDSQAGKFPCTVKAVNLYDCMLAICEKMQILEAIPKQELKTGTEKQVEQLGAICSPEAFAEELLERTQPHDYGDVVLITGVGEVYPYLRIHDLLNNILDTFASVPVVVFYPGTFNGSSFRLFSRFDASNYYRAFDLTEEQ